MRKTVGIMLMLLAIGAIFGFASPANADVVNWVAATTTTDGRTFTIDELGQMVFYVRIDQPNPKDTVGKATYNQPGTWYYAGERRLGATFWPTDNALTTLLQSYGMSGKTVRFTVSQAFKDTDGVERDSALSEIVAYQVPVPFVPRTPSAPGSLTIAPPK